MQAVSHLCAAAEIDDRGSGVVQQVSAPEKVSIGTAELWQGDCRAVLGAMPAQSVHCCVTSPPYFGLRDYGHADQIGLETTPDEYVAQLVEVFREVRRVLRDDGTLWLNLGDSYAANGCSGLNVGWAERAAEYAGGGHRAEPSRNRSTKRVPEGLKIKDLIGIPWRVAFALQQPYYTGNVSDERDRVWLAAMVDAEGSICGTEYQTGDRTKTNIYISVTNTSVPIIAKCERLFPQDVKHVYEKSGPSIRICYRWDVERMETKALFLREIYPHLVAKRKQAIVGYTFIEMQRGLFSKKKGYLPEQQEQRSRLMAALSSLNAGKDVDLPDWVIEPPPLFEPGFYLRQDIIWAKPNPMPESVTDRCTKSHEYLFLLSKSPRYYFDNEAIKEPVAAATVVRLSQNVDAQAGSDRVPGKTNGPMKAVRSKANSFKREGSKREQAIPGQSVGTHRPDRAESEYDLDTRNKRSVWTVATRPFKDAHFATFPPALIEPCILAGCPEGGTVLDPFGGAGTTAVVAGEHGRSAILIELNGEYIDIACRRIEDAQRQQRMFA